MRVSKRAINAGKKVTSLRIVLELKEESVSTAKRWAI
jgi:hypothetical protein